MRYVTATVEDRVHQIPDIWLFGATRQDIAAGMEPKEAYAKAIRHWDEQERLEREHLAQQEQQQ